MGENAAPAYLAEVVRLLAATLEAEAGLLVRETLAA
jgi:hypothetical protein